MLHVGSLDDDPAVGDIVQLVDGSDCGGFARPGQTHDHEYLALLDLEGDVLHADHVAGLALDLVLAHPGGGEVESAAPRVGAEDLVDVLKCDDRLGLSHASPWTCWNLMLGAGSIHVRYPCNGRVAE